MSITDLADADRRLLLAAGAVIMILGLIFLRRMPRTAFVLWTITLCFVPYWLGITISLYAPPTTAVAAIAVAAMLGSRGLRLSLVDAVVAVIVVVHLLVYLAGDAEIASAFVLVTHWLLGYILGRMVTSRMSIDWVYKTLAVAFSVVSVLAIIEFITQVNFFVLVPASNNLYTSWGALQFRGGLLRAEGAFGHSIALGACLAMAVPMAVASSFRPWIRGAMIVVMITASAVTLSRIGMICSILALLMCVVFLKDVFTTRARVILIGSVAAAGALLSPFLIATFTEAGDEATDSAGYRGDLLSLVPQMAAIGRSSAAARSATGDVYYGQFRSVDSALIYFGLNHGLLPLILVLVLLAVAGFYVLRGRATAPTIAIVAQIPAIATVALLTQYAMFFWVMCGLAVATQLASSRPVSPESGKLSRPLRSPVGAPLG